MHRTLRFACAVVFIAAIGAAYRPNIVEGKAPMRVSQAKGAAPAAGDACSLLSKEDAAAALGGTVTGPKAIAPRDAGPGSTVSSCEYTGSGYLKVQLILRTMPADQAVFYKGFCAQKGKEGLTGLGEVACWYDAKHEELQVMKGLKLISIELRGKPNPTDAIKAVMKKAYDQLK